MWRQRSEGTSSYHRCVRRRFRYRFRLHLYGNSTQRPAVTSHEFDDVSRVATLCQERCKRHTLCTFYPIAVRPSAQCHLWCEPARFLVAPMPLDEVQPISSRPASSLVRVRAFAPGGIGNLGPGLDILGCATDGPGDAVDAERVDYPGVRVDDPGHPELPTDPTRHAAAIAAAEVLRRAGASSIGLAIRVHKDLPLAGGQGGSAASAIAGAVAANAIIGFPLDTHELLLAALVAEERVAGRHLDNLAPALVGGIVLIRSIDPVAIVRFTAPETLRIVLVHPDMRLRTADARAVLPATIDRATSMAQAAAVSTMIAAFATGDLTLLRGAIEDRIAEPARTPLLPGFARAKAAALNAGALGASIAGGGPSSFAMTDGDAIATPVLAAMLDAYAASGIQATGRIARVDDRGARIMTDAGMEMPAVRA